MSGVMPKKVCLFLSKFNNLISQQDNARPCPACVSLACLHDVTMLLWPVGSLDLSPFENDWDETGQHLWPEKLRIFLKRTSNVCMSPCPTISPAVSVLRVMQHRTKCMTKVLVHCNTCLVWYNNLMFSVCILPYPVPEPTWRAPAMATSSEVPQSRPQADSWLNLAGTSASFANILGTRNSLAAAGAHPHYSPLIIFSYLSLTPLVNPFYISTNALLPLPRRCCNKRLLNLCTNTCSTALQLSIASKDVLALGDNATVDFIIARRLRFRRDKTQPGWVFAVFIAASTPTACFEDGTKPDPTFVYTLQQRSLVRWMPLQTEFNHLFNPTIPRSRSVRKDKLAWRFLGGIDVDSWTDGGRLRFQYVTKERVGDKRSALRCPSNLVCSIQLNESHVTENARECYPVSSRSALPTPLVHPFKGTDLWLERCHTAWVQRPYPETLHFDNTLETSLRIAFHGECTATDHTDSARSTTDSIIMELLYSMEEDGLPYLEMSPLLPIILSSPAASPMSPLPSMMPPPMTAYSDDAPASADSFDAASLVGAASTSISDSFNVYAEITSSGPKSIKSRRDISMPGHLGVGCLLGLSEWRVAVGGCSGCAEVGRWRRGGRDENGDSERVFRRVRELSNQTCPPPECRCLSGVGSHPKSDLQAVEAKYAAYSKSSKIISPVVDLDFDPLYSLVVELSIFGNTVPVTCKEDFWKLHLLVGTLLDKITGVVFVWENGTCGLGCEFGILCAMVNVGEEEEKLSGGVSIPVSLHFLLGACLNVQGSSQCVGRNNILGSLDDSFGKPYPSSIPIRNTPVVIDLAIEGSKGENRLVLSLSQGNVHACVQQQYGGSEEIHHHAGRSYDVTMLTEYPQGHRPARFPRAEIRAATALGIEHGSPWWEVSSLITSPQRPLAVTESKEARGAPGSAERCLVATTGKEFSLAHSDTFHTPLRYSRRLLNLPEQRFPSRAEPRKYQCLTESEDNAPRYTMSTGRQLLPANTIPPAASQTLFATRLHSVVRIPEQSSFVHRPLPLRQDSFSIDMRLWSSTGMKGQEKEDISEKTHRSAASYSMIPTFENLEVTRPMIEHIKACIQLRYPKLYLKTKDTLIGADVMALSQQTMSQDKAFIKLNCYPKFTASPSPPTPWWFTGELSERFTLPTPLPLTGRVPDPYGAVLRPLPYHHPTPTLNNMGRTWRTETCLVTGERSEAAFSPGNTLGGEARKTNNSSVGFLLALSSRQQFTVPSPCGV
ncbi:hypothetical protein PR048_018661 [Dryococelus australis]|uniref:Uncharacterized protein n=1 Tax=Dryococelus australis TaxID=614101 RepID=A0ABQ9HDN1_9NEOP|nr:hypothetical protein PR048_018661 [Dryococelus australis]